LLTAQFPYLEVAKVGLFTNNIVPDDDTVIGDLVPGAWSGYVTPALGPMQPATIVDGRAVTTPVSLPLFTNGSGAPVIFYGYYLMKADGTKLAGVVYLGAQTLLPTRTTAVVVTITDTEEP